MTTNITSHPDNPEEAIVKRTFMTNRKREAHSGINQPEQDTLVPLNEGQ